MDSLFAWLHRAAGDPHEWGHSDCMMLLADWVRHVTGTDPAEGLRDSYGDPAICPVGRAYRNDPRPVCTRAFLALEQTCDPQRGDIALGEVRGNRFLCGAICMGGGHWAFRPEAGGLLFLRRAFRPVLAWRVPHAA